MGPRDKSRAAAAALLLLVLGACQAPVADVETGSEFAGEVSRDNGREMFWAGRCASCHAGAGRLSTRAPALGGGEPLKTQLGVFRAPNISQDVTSGIGAWSLAEFDRAMRQGLAPDGHAYYPAFPYTSYARMTDRDIGDLFAFLKTLPAVVGDVEDSDLVFPVNLPIAAQTWRRRYLSPDPAVDLPAATPEVARGQYLVEGPGHCGTCHTPRSAFGGPRYGRWLGGAEMLDDTGFAPNLTSHSDGLGDRSIEEIVEAMRPSAPSEVPYEGMAAARIDLAQLPESDLYAIAAYLKALPPVATSP